MKVNKYNLISKELLQEWHKIQNKSTKDIHSKLFKIKDYKIIYNEILNFEYIDINEFLEMKKMFIKTFSSTKDRHIETKLNNLNQTYDIINKLELETTSIIINTILNMNYYDKMFWTLENDLQCFNKLVTQGLFYKLLELAIVSHKDECFNKLLNFIRDINETNDTENKFVNTYQKELYHVFSNKSSKSSKLDKQSGNSNNFSFNNSSNGSLYFNVLLYLDEMNYPLEILYKVVKYGESTNIKVIITNILTVNHLLNLLNLNFKQNINYIKNIIKLYDNWLELTSCNDEAIRNTTRINLINFTNIEIIDLYNVDMFKQYNTKDSNNKAKFQTFCHVIFCCLIQNYFEIFNPLDKSDTLTLNNNDKALQLKFKQIPISLLISLLKWRFAPELINIYINFLQEGIFNKVT